jgi:hypothetical protein
LILVSYDMPLNLSAMRKLYLFFLLLFSGTLTFGADITWTNAGGGNWNQGSNWSGGVVPGAADRAIFNSSVTVTMNLATINILGVRVTNNAAVVFTTNANTTMNATGNGASPAISIDGGSTLTTRTTSDVGLNYNFAAAATGLVNGTWVLEGTTVLNTGFGANIGLQPTTVLTINGRITRGINGSNIIGSTPTNLIFGAGSFFTVLSDEGGVIPNATWNTTSTIEVLGSVFGLPTFSTGFVPSYGNVLINLPNLNDSYSLALPDNTVIKGNLTIQNTNNFVLVIIGNNEVSFSSPVTVTINGNFVVNGASARIAIADTDEGNQEKNYDLVIGGNLVQSAGEISIQDFTDAPAATGITTVRLFGNFTQTGGDFTANSALTSATSLYVLEMAGTAQQTIQSSDQSIDNGNNMVTLLINNNAGVLLNSPLSVGRLAFTAGAITTTSTNLLTVNDRAPAAVVNAGVGRFVDGPVRRLTNQNQSYLFPTGKAATYDPITLIPSAASNGDYRAEYFNAGFSDLSVDVTLNGVTNSEYWDVVRTNGPQAEVLLTINQPVSGATVMDTVLVARYNGADWSNVRGSTGTFVYPGNASSGTVRSQLLSNTTGRYTFGYKVDINLPVLLLSFTAEKQGNAGMLNWTVDRTTIPRYTEILKSTDGRNFSVLSTIDGEFGKVSYSLLDPQLANGTNYYRLRMVENSGEVTLSRIVALIHNVRGFAITNIAPSIVQASTVLTVSASKGGTMELFITDMQGRVWRRLAMAVPAGNSRQSIFLGDLASGSYQINAYLDGLPAAPVRMIKQ